MRNGVCICGISRCPTHCECGWPGCHVINQLHTPFISRTFPEVAVLRRHPEPVEHGLQEFLKFCATKLGSISYFLSLGVAASRSSLLSPPDEPVSVMFYLRKLFTVGFAAASDSAVALSCCKRRAMVSRPFGTFFKIHIVKQTYW